ncbi:MAG: SIS domain-containing protein [Planctomycetota bacterium]|nr:MAG: SIS domain-containing protein [Planctomycetota bacterium]
MTGLQDHDRLSKQLHDQVDLLKKISQAIIDSLESGGRIYTLGNGGSAADAQHIAAEFVGRFKRERRPLPASALTTDTSNLLAISNDYGFGHVFTRQIEAHVRRGDVVWALSTSGESPNIIEAIHVARAAEAVIIGFTGKGGGKLKPLCDYCLCVNHPASDRIQEIHQLAYHLICDFVEQHFANDES